MLSGEEMNGNRVILIARALHSAVFPFRSVLYRIFVLEEIRFERAEFSEL